MKFLPGDQEFETMSDKHGNASVPKDCGHHIWSSSERGRMIAMEKQIFCNRSLNMKNIIAVGFDMDYTLAQYMPETFESLAYEGTVRKLVYDLGYPSEVRGFYSSYNYTFNIIVLNPVYMISFSMPSSDSYITGDKIISFKIFKHYTRPRECMRQQKRPWSGQYKQINGAGGWRKEMENIQV